MNFAGVGSPPNHQLELGCKMQGPLIEEHVKAESGGKRLMLQRGIATLLSKGPDCPPLARSHSATDFITDLRASCTNSRETARETLYELVGLD